MDRQNSRIQVLNSAGNLQRVVNNNAMVEQLPSLTIDQSNLLIAVVYSSATNASTIIKYDSSENETLRFAADGTPDRIEALVSRCDD